MSVIWLRLPSRVLTDGPNPTMSLLAFPTAVSARWLVCSKLASSFVMRPSRLMSSVVFLRLLSIAINGPSSDFKRPVRSCMLARVLVREPSGAVMAVRLSAVMRSLPNAPRSSPSWPKTELSESMVWLSRPRVRVALLATGSMTDRTRGRAEFRSGTRSPTKE